VYFWHKVLQSLVNTGDVAFLPRKIAAKLFENWQNEGEMSNSKDYIWW